MNSIGQTTAKLLIMGLVFSGCNPATADDAAGESALGPSTEDVVEATATTKPTQAPTPTVWPPIFDPAALEDIRLLDSFVVTINEKNTVNGQLTELTSTIGYIKEPFSAYEILEFPGGEEKTYVVDGSTYAVNGGGDWYLSARATNDLFFKADIPAGNTGKLVDAQFASLEEFQGIPAYHFVLDQTNSTIGTNVQIEGDFYVAQTGNYVLYSHWKESTSQGNFAQVYEVTEALSSINQLTEITLSGEFLEMKAALDLPLELGLPLPADTNLYRMIRYLYGIGIDYYTFTTPKISKDEFLDFYRNLAPTNGWTVSHVGKVSLHENDCEFSADCVIINKGSTQVILYYNGANIRAEFDWRHLYSPL